MDEEKLLARMSAVKKIARRTGYPLYKAEDIAQQVAVHALKGRNVESQTNYQSFVDAVKEGSERTYTRGGHFIVPLFESEFEDYSGIVSFLRFENDPGNVEENSRNIFDLVSVLTEIEPTRRRAIILHFYYGWTLDEISKFEGVSESRISQRCTDAIKRLKKKIVSSRLSQEKQAKRKLTEYRALSQDLQTGSIVVGEAKRELEKIYGEEGFFMDSFEIQEIPESLCASF